MDEDVPVAFAMPPAQQPRRGVLRGEVADWNQVAGAPPPAPVTFTSSESSAKYASAAGLLANR